MENLDKNNLVQLEAHNLCVSFNDRPVLKNISFQIKAGEVFALLGGNGAGKSTTLKTFLGLIDATSGNVNVMGQSVSDNPNIIRQKVAYLPESVMLYEHLSAIENIQYFLSVAGVECDETAIKNALDKVSLQSKSWQQKLSFYSKGMRQKTAIALALLRNTPILLLDEPTSGLDPVAIDELNELIRELAKSGTSILMVTHDVYGACHVANRIGLLRDGSIVGVFESDNGASINTEDVHAAFAQGVVK
jgi:ABC-2 type transport system ATP-binding protein